MKPEEMTLDKKLFNAFQQRAQLLDGFSNSAVRLFNGFLEGDPRWVVEIFGKTLVINDHTHAEIGSSSFLPEISALYRQWIPWLETVLVKQRYASQLEEKRGKIIYGGLLPNEISEAGVRYALNLTLNQDASFYLDTRNLRAWLLEQMAGKTVLNTFAYTGSLGVAALAGGAAHLIQVDLNQRFLDLTKASCTLNNISPEKVKFIVADFYRAIGNLKQNQKLVDCVILDPPFFSATNAGRVDLVNQSARLINKVRPLIAHQGWLAVVNNALFLSGQAYMEMLEELCADRYMEIETIIPVPQDVTGFQETIVSEPPVAVAPFNHSTKIVILKIKRKDEKTTH
ncbi:MAG: class I SAM-dependent methyltransferase [Anaerolineaceae bacterium]|jgi:23S rRNA (cytosine1962-C5)-methyltransferase|nr:class I SAM-dependent methyltransferase [Anaerolineaceae bacterium]